MGWFGPRGCAESCCEDDCTLCEDCTDTAIPDPLSTYTSTCTTLTNDWLVDFKIEGWGDGDLELVAGPVTATIKELNDGFGPYHRVDFPNDQNKLADGCTGPTTTDTASPSFPIYVRIAYRTEEVTRGVDCVSTEIHESVTVSILFGDPCAGSPTGTGVCQASKYTSKPTGNSIELNASGTGSVVTEIRVLNRVVDNIPCVETEKCFPCTISSGDIAHWKDFSYSVSGFPGAGDSYASDPYGSSGTYLELWRETKGWNHQCAATETDLQHQDFYCGTDYRLFTREIMGWDAINGTYTPKLIDRLDPTETAIPLGSEPADLLDPTSSLCDDQRYFWLIEIPVVPVVIVERIQREVCPGAFNEGTWHEIYGEGPDTTTVILGYFRATSPGRTFLFYEVKRYTAQGQAGYDAAISGGAGGVWNLTEEVATQHIFGTSPDPDFGDNYLAFGDFEYDPWQPSLTAGEEIEDVNPTKMYMPVVSLAFEPVKKYWNYSRTRDLGKCDGTSLYERPLYWTDLDFTRTSQGRYSLFESTFTNGPCYDKYSSVESRSDPFSFTTIRTSDYDLEGGCV